MHYREMLLDFRKVFYAVKVFCFDWCLLRCERRFPKDASPRVHGSRVHASRVHGSRVHGFPRAWITLSGTENHLVFLYSNISQPNILLKQDQQSYMDNDGPICWPCFNHRNNSYICSTTPNFRLLSAPTFYLTCLQCK